MPTRRKSKRMTKAQINYAMLAHVEKRVGALEDKYNGLGGAVDALDLRVRELGRQVMELKDDARRRAYVHQMQYALYLAAIDELVREFRKGPIPKAKPPTVKCTTWTES